MKKTIYLSLLILLVTLSAQATVRRPFLEVPTPTSIWVNWKSDVDSNFTIHYGTDPNNLTFSKSVKSETWSDNGYNANYIYNSVQLTNLSPNTFYYYQITNATYSSEVYNFRSYPEPGNSTLQNGISRFLIIGDNQLRDEPRYDSLVVKAKRHIENRYGMPIQEAITSVITTGDQVDVGTLDHYENVLYDRTKYITPYLGFSTIIGNHETYGTLKLQAYYDHFHYDSIVYKVPSRSEDYYAYQAGNLLIINLMTEGGSDLNAAQTTWLREVVDSADVDPTVDWIMAVVHRPYQAEQYVGDISNWVRNTAYPILITSPKMFICVGAHHHLYARGQDKNAPVYNIISGGTAWDQYWGMSSEQDFDDVQKTIPRWAYQILEIDNNAQKATITSYSVGYTTRINEWSTYNPSKFVWEESVLIDSFYVARNLAAPQKPSITNVPTDSIELPYTFMSSAYATSSNELYNSTHFQVASSTNFSSLSFDVIRDYENWFGQGNHQWETLDINENTNIFAYTPTERSLPDGTYFMRVRHRDRAMNWSEWSDTISFKIKNGGLGTPEVRLNKNAFAINETFTVEYANGPGNTKDWVGIYKSGQNPGGIPSTVWNYVQSSSLHSGALNFTLSQPGEYYAVLLENDGYNELSNRVYFYVGTLPELSMTKSEFDLLEPVTITVGSAPANSTDWIGVYKIGNTPHTDLSAAYQYITSSETTNYTFENLPKGYYFARYFLNDGYNAIGDELYFSVGDTIATVILDKNAYNLGDFISVTFADGPGISKDYLGVFEKDEDPNNGRLLNYVYVDGKPSGEATFESDNLPTSAGNYFIVLFTNDSYNEISNRAYFKLKSSVTSVENNLSNDFKIFPNPTIPGKETTIRYTHPIEMISIYDMKGNMIYAKRNFGGESNVIFNHSLPAGIYMVKIHSDEVYTLKLIVNSDN